MKEKETKSKRDVPFNFGESPVMKQTEQKLIDGYSKEPAQQTPALQPIGEMTAQGQQPMQAATILQEPSQNINIPIPKSKHQRLKVISANTYQPMKELVVQAIDLWLDVQEGKVEIKH